MRAWVLFSLVICTSMSFCSIAVMADSHGRFSGKGSAQAYNKSCEPGNRAVDVAKNGDIQEAIKLDKEAISIYPFESCWHHNLGNHLEKIGKLEDARKEQERAIELEPEYLAAWLALGYEFELQRKFTDAERCYRKCVQIKPDYFESLGDLGDILRKQGKFDEAREWLLKAKARPNFPPALAGEIQRKLEQCNRKEASD